MLFHQDWNNKQNKRLLDKQLYFWLWVYTLYILTLQYISRTTFNSNLIELSILHYSPCEGRSKREKLARSRCISGISRRRKHTLISYIKIISRVAKFIVYCYSSSEGLIWYRHGEKKKKENRLLKQESECLIQPELMYLIFSWT